MDPVERIVRIAPACAACVPDHRAGASKAYVALVFSLFSPAEHFAHQIFIVVYY